MLRLSLLSYATVLLGLVLGSVIPPDVAVISRDEIRTFVDKPQWTTKEITVFEPMVSARGPSSSVVLAVLSHNAAITTAACTFGGPIVCGIAAVSSIIVGFYALYSPTGPADKGPVPREIQYVAASVHQQFLPSQSLSTLDKLKAHTADGAWTSFGNTTLNDVYHDLHFQRRGSMLGVKAVPFFPGINRKRDDTKDSGGFVATYFWEDNNQKAWNDWNNAQVNPIADDIAHYIFDNAADVVCADILDQDGPIDVGVVTMGINNDELGLEPSQWDSAMKICKAGET